MHKWHECWITKYLQWSLKRDLRIKNLPFILLCYAKLVLTALTACLMSMQHQSGTNRPIANFLSVFYIVQLKLSFLYSNFYFRFGVQTDFGVLTYK